MTGSGGGRRGVRTPLRGVVALALVATLIVACTDDDGPATVAPGRGTTATSIERVTTTTIPRRLDGILVIGALLPQSGAGATLGESLIAGASLAVSQINRAGGVNGMPVRLEIRDEGADVDTAGRSLDALIDARADVVVGPASSRIALGLLAQIIEPGLTACSPTATALSLRRFPDDGRFFRTVPSDALQAAALAEVMERTGLGVVSVVYIDDEFGLDVATSLEEELERRGITVTSHAYGSSELALSNVADGALGSGAQAIAVIGDATDGARMLTALRAADDRDDDVMYFVNDPLRGAGSAAGQGSNGEAFLARVRGISPWSAPRSDAFVTAFAERFADTPMDFAAYAYDCTMLLALAAATAGSDDPTLIARTVTSVSRNGSPCMSFEECSQFLAEGRNIDYVGSSGPVDLDENGEVQSATFSVFGFEPPGRDKTITDLTL